MSHRLGWQAHETGVGRRGGPRVPWGRGQLGRFGQGRAFVALQLAVQAWGNLNHTRRRLQHRAARWTPLEGAALPRHSLDLVEASHEAAKRVKPRPAAVEYGEAWGGAEAASLFAQLQQLRPACTRFAPLAVRTCAQHLTSFSQRRHGCTADNQPVHLSAVVCVKCGGIPEQHRHHRAWCVPGVGTSQLLPAVLSLFLRVGSSQGCG